MNLEQLENANNLKVKIAKIKKNIKDIDRFKDINFSLYQNNYYCKVPTELNDTIIALIEMQLNKNLEESEKLFEEL